MGVAAAVAHTVSEERLIALESRLAYQEHTLGELNEALVAQQRQLDALERTCELLRQRLSALGEEGAGGEEAEKPPPHY